MGAGHRHVRRRQEPLAAQGGAGHEARRIAEGEFGDVHRVEAVHVLGGVQGEDDSALVNVPRRGGLDQDTIHGRVGVELRDEVEQRGLGGVGG